jgi:hypothetical protein
MKLGNRPRVMEKDDFLGLERGSQSRTFSNRKSALGKKLRRANFQYKNQKRVTSSAMHDEDDLIEQENGRVHYSLRLQHAHLRELVKGYIDSKIQYHHRDPQ